MKLTMITETRSHFGDEEETHIIKVNGETHMSQSEGIEPEDVRFYRNLASPFDCLSIIEKVIAAVKAGEEIEFEWVDESENDGE